MAGGRGGGSAARRPRYRGLEAVVRRAGGHGWLQALPSATAGSAPWCSAASRPRRSSSTRTPCGPAARTTPPTRAAPRRCAEIRRLVVEEKWAEAQQPGRPGHARAAGRADRVPAGRQPAAVVPGARAASEYRRELDLDTAVATVSSSPDGVRYRREVFASAADQVIVVRLTAERAGRGLVHREVRQPAAHDHGQLRRRDDRAGRGLGRHGGREGLGAVPGAGPRGRRGRDRQQLDGTLTVAGADAVTLLISIGTSYVDYRDSGGDYQGSPASTRCNAAAQRATGGSARGTSRTTAAVPPGRRSTSGRTAAAELTDRRADRAARAAPTTRSSPRCTSSSAATC